MKIVASSTSIEHEPNVERAGLNSPSEEFPFFLKLDVCGIALGAVSSEGRPIVGKGVGCVVENNRMRITAQKSVNEALIEAVLQGSPIAATFSQPTTHRSMQFKAPSGRLDDPSKRDFLAAHLQRERFSVELIESAYPPEFTQHYTAFAPHELVVVEIRPADTFDQTPGPAAGVRLP